MKMAILSTWLSAAGLAVAGTFSQIADFGSNPGNSKMFLYVPTNSAAKPAILVAMHHCQGTAQSFYDGTPFRTQADRHGFLVIYPDANRSGQCWDVHSTQSLSHNGGGDAGSIVSMVRWAVKNRNGDSTRVYATGTSSGAMMTNVMLGSYPEVFKAGAAYAGVPFACFAGAGEWNPTCAGGRSLKTPEQWGDLVRAAYPGYSGPRPRMQLWHGDRDETLNFANFAEAIDQWSNVLGVSRTPTSTENDVPRNGWIRTRYRDNAGVIQVEAIQETGVTHGIQILADSTMAFFGLDKPASTALEKADRRGGASLRISRGAGILRFSVSAAPGPIAVGILRADGSRAASLGEIPSDGGGAEFSWNGGTSPVASAGVYFAVARSDGVILDRKRFTFSP